MKSIMFVVEIEPRPMPRPRFSNGRAYVSRDVRAYQEQVKAAAIEAMQSFGVGKLKGSVHMRLLFYGRFAPTSRRSGDVDNLSKAIMDALNGLAFDDDAQITSLFVEKWQDKERPRVEVDIFTV